MGDLYAVLGVAPFASQDEIRLAFRRVAFESHPDHHPGDVYAERRFKEAARAYGILSDPVLRSKYDGFMQGGGTAVHAPVRPAYRGPGVATEDWWATREVWENGVCPDCEGTGQLRDAIQETCLLCQGWGSIAMPGPIAMWRVCAVC